MGKETVAQGEGQMNGSSSMGSAIGVASGAIPPAGARLFVRECIVADIMFTTICCATNSVVYSVLNHRCLQLTATSYYPGDVVDSDGAGEGGCRNLGRCEECVFAAPPSNQQLGAACKLLRLVGRPENTRSQVQAAVVLFAAD